jgi:hypothetical protein
MAKDKNKEAAYKEEGRRRIVQRQLTRKANWSKRIIRYGRGIQSCSMCGGQMSWCSCCEVWSSTCCCDYGTCQCS